MENLISCKMDNEEAVVTTHCLYPSFENVLVFVRKTHEGFYVHDSSNAYANAWTHGRDSRVIGNEISKAARNYHLKVHNRSLFIEVPDANWLQSAIIAVANGSAQAATRSTAKTSKALENSVRENIAHSLKKPIFSSYNVSSEVEITGGSGKQYRFDFLISRNDSSQVLVEIVTPHHSSISHKYMAFADVVAGGVNRNSNIAVFGRKLAQDDTTLMSQVADLLPYKSFEQGTLRALSNA